MSDYTADERIINGAAQQLQLMLETSPYSPAECLRRVFAPLLERVRADVKAAGVEIPSADNSPLQQILALAQTSLKPDVYPDEESWLRSKLRDIERIASKAVA
jgi:hypothetical protein